MHLIGLSKLSLKKCLQLYILHPFGATKTLFVSSVSAILYFNPLTKVLTKLATSDFSKTVVCEIS